MVLAAESWSRSRLQLCLRLLQAHLGSILVGVARLQAGQVGACGGEPGARGGDVGLGDAAGGLLILGLGLRDARLGLGDLLGRGAVHQIDAVGLGLLEVGLGLLELEPQIHIVDPRERLASLDRVAGGDQNLCHRGIHHKVQIGLCARLDIAGGADRRIDRPSLRGLGLPARRGGCLRCRGHGVADQHPRHCADDDQGEDHPSPDQRLATEAYPSAGGCDRSHISSSFVSNIRISVIIAGSTPMVIGQLHDQRCISGRIGMVRKVEIDLSLSTDRAPSGGRCGGVDGWQYTLEYAAATERSQSGPADPRYTDHSPL